MSAGLNGEFVLVPHGLGGYFVQVKDSIQSSHYTAGRPKRMLLRRLIRGAVFLFGLSLIFNYAWAPRYDFPPPAPFAGSQWYNPYEGVEDSWLRANFHAHSKTWPLTRVENIDSQDLVKAYRDLDYDIYGISNYQMIVPPLPGTELPMPAYEHGWGLAQYHHTVVGAASVDWLDFPYFQGVHEKQYVLESLSRNAELVIVNHPEKHGAFSPAEMARLTGYTAIEVGTKHSRTTEHWDAALSSGRPVWGICSDDSHGVERTRVGIGWLMIPVEKRETSAVFEAIRAGRFYGAWTRRGQRLTGGDVLVVNELVSCKLEDGILQVTSRKPADTIRFVGQGGLTLAEVKGEAEARYQLQPTDTYVRTEIENLGTVLYLNPVLRYDGEGLSFPVATPNLLLTWSLRSAGFVGLVLLAWGAVLPPWAGFAERVNRIGQAPLCPARPPESLRMSTHARGR